MNPAADRIASEVSEEMDAIVDLLKNAGHTELVEPVLVIFLRAVTLSAIGAMVAQLPDDEPPPGVN